MMPIISLVFRHSDSFAIAYRAYPDSIAVSTLVTLHTNSANWKQGCSVFLLPALLGENHSLLLSCYSLDSVQESMLLGHHLIVVDHEAAEYLSLTEVSFHVRFSICAKDSDGKTRSREGMPHRCGSPSRVRPPCLAPSAFSLTVYRCDVS